MKGQRILQTSPLNCGQIWSLPVTGLNESATLRALPFRLAVSAAGPSRPAALNSGGGRGNSEVLTDICHQNNWYSHKPVLQGLRYTHPHSLREEQQTGLWKWRAIFPSLPMITGLHWAQTLHYTWGVLGAVCGSSSGLVRPEPGSSRTSGLSESSYHVWSHWQDPSDRQGLVGSPAMSSGRSPLDGQLGYAHSRSHRLNPKGSNRPCTRETRGMKSAQSRPHCMQE